MTQINYSNINDDPIEITTTNTDPIPRVFRRWEDTLSVVYVNKDGSTQRGWSVNRQNPELDFMENFKKGKFKPHKAVSDFLLHKTPFAFIMRSVPLICVDIDGKNGGWRSARQLFGGLLPHTLAETSKSGKGVHLFFKVEDEWDEQLGYARYADRIALLPGIDIRGVGCVYHYPNQKWNSLPIAAMPDRLRTMLETTNREAIVKSGEQELKDLLKSGDSEAILMQIATLTIDMRNISEVKGNRNNNIYAIGSKLCALGAEDWEDLVYETCDRVDLPEEEADKLVRNIRNSPLVRELHN